jgi:hypothetical protein
LKVAGWSLEVLEEEIGGVWLTELNLNQKSCAIKNARVDWLGFIPSIFRGDSWNP